MDDLLFERLEKGLLPEGTAKVTRIHISKYYKHNFIKKCLKELKIKNKMIECGLEELSNLEILAINILFNSAYMDLDQIIKERTKP